MRLSFFLRHTFIAALPRMCVRTYCGFIVVKCGADDQCNPFVCKCQGESNKKFIAALSLGNSGPMINVTRLCARVKGKVIAALSRVTRGHKRLKAAIKVKTQTQKTRLAAGVSGEQFQSMLRDGSVTPSDRTTHFGTPPETAGPEGIPKPLCSHTVPQNPRMGPAFLHRLPARSRW